MINFIMKHHGRIILLPVLAIFLLFPGCAGEEDKKAKENQISETQSTSVEVALQISNETELLLKDLSENRDYVNGRNFPSLIKASAVYDFP